MMENKELIQSAAKHLTTFFVLHLILNIENTAVNKKKLFWWVYILQI